MNYASLTAAMVAASRKVTSFFKEPDVVEAWEAEAIINDVHRSLKDWGHCECPWPVNWPLRRGLWMGEVAEINYREANAIDHDNPFGVEPVEKRLIQWNGEFVDV